MMSVTPSARQCGVVRRSLITTMHGTPPAPTRERRDRRTSRPKMGRVGCRSPTTSRGHRVSVTTAAESDAVAGSGARRRESGAEGDEQSALRTFRRAPRARQHGPPPGAKARLNGSISVWNSARESARRTGRDDPAECRTDAARRPLRAGTVNALGGAKQSSRSPPRRRHVNVASHSGIARPATMKSSALPAAWRREASQPMPINDAYIRPMVSRATSPGILR